MSTGILIAMTVVVTALTAFVGIGAIVNAVRLNKELHGEARDRRQSA